MPPLFQEWYGDPPGRLHKQFTRHYNDPAFGRRKLFNRFIMDVKGPGYSTEVLIFQAASLDMGLCDTLAFGMACQEARLFQNGSCVIHIIFINVLTGKRNLRRTQYELINQNRLWLQESSAIKTVRKIDADCFRRSSTKEYTLQLIDNVLHIIYGTVSKEYDWIIGREYGLAFPSPQKPLTAGFLDCTVYSKTTDYWVSAHTLRTVHEDSVLDPNDTLCDIVDDREQLIADFEDHGGPRSHDSGVSSAGTGSQEVFAAAELACRKSRHHRGSSLDSGHDVIVTDVDIYSGTSSGQTVRRESELALNVLEDKNLSPRSKNKEDTKIKVPYRLSANGSWSSYRRSRFSFRFALLCVFSVFMTQTQALSFGDATSYPVIESSLCSRQSYENWSCPLDSSVLAEVVKNCKFGSKCGESFEPECIPPKGSGSLYICVEKNLTCPAGHILSVHLPKNQPDIVTGSIVSCPDGQYKLSPSDCFEACVPHANISNIPAEFRIISFGGVASTTKIACDETKGFYNTDGICSFDYDLNVDGHQYYYRFFCTHVSDPQITNPCRKEEEKFGDGVMCVPKCAEDNESKRGGTNCTCIHIHVASNDTNSSRRSTEAAPLTTTPASPVLTKTSPFQQSETRGDKGPNYAVIFGVIGVFSLLILIAIIIAMCCFWRRKQRKTGNGNTPNGHAPFEIIEMENGGIPNGHTPTQIENGNIPNGHTSIPNGVTKISQQTYNTGQNVFQIGDYSNLNIHFHTERSTSSMENGQGMEELQDSSSIPFIDSGAGQEENTEARTQPFEGAVPETQLFEDVEAGTESSEGIRRDPEGESADPDQTYRKQLYTEAGPSTDESEVDEHMVLLEASIDSSEEREQTKRKLLYED